MSEAQAMLEWFSEYMYGINDIAGNIPAISKERLGLVVPGSLSHVVTKLTELQDEDLTAGMLYVCGYPDSALEAFGFEQSVLSRVRQHFTQEPEDMISIPEKPVLASSAMSQTSRRSMTESKPERGHIDGTGGYLKQLGRRALLTAEEEVELSKDIEAGLYAQHLLDTNAARNHNLRDLRLMARIGEQATNRMVESNLRLSVSIAKRYRWNLQHMSFDDVIQHANLGLIHSVQKYDYARGNKFSTYATWWIKQSVTRGIQDEDRTIRLPVHVGEKTRAIGRARDDFILEHNRMPTDEDIAAEMEGISAEMVRGVRGAQTIISLDMPVGDTQDTSLGDLIAADTISDEHESSIVENGMIELGVAERIKNLLSPQEYEVFIRRQEEGFGEIGADYGVSREHIRQVDFRSKAKLQHPSAGIGQQLNQGLAWQEEAVCQTVGTDLFFLAKGASARDAKAVCAGCPVAHACLTHALEANMRYGIWGAKSERERRVIAFGETLDDEGEAQDATAV